MKKYFTKSIKTLTLLATAGIVTTLAACSNPSDTTNADSSANEPQTEEVKSETTSAGQALAQELQGKPVVVDIYADWCAGCRKIKPTLEALKKEYGDKANFVVLDVTDKTTSEASANKAKELGLEEVFSKYKAKTATVAVMNPSTGEVVKLFQKNPNKADYVAALDTTTQQISNN